MSSMPVAAGMDAPQEQTTAEPFVIPQAPRDTSSDTNMRADILPASDTPALFDWDGAGGIGYSMEYDIGTKSPDLSVSGSLADQPSGNAGGATGGSLPRNMNPQPYGAGS